MRTPRALFVLISTLILPIALSCAADPLDIRVRRDELRDRTWALRADALYLHETGRPVRRFALPGWIYASPGLACEPDVIVEAGGTVIVSSNIMTSLWRIDPDASKVVELKLEIQPETNRELGFTTLRLTGDGVLQAGGSLDMSRWQIDLWNQRAVKVGDSVASAPLLACR